MRVNLKASERKRVEHLVAKDPDLSFIANASYDQIDEWIDNGIHSIRDVRIMLKLTLKLLCFLIKDRINLKEINRNAS